MSQRERESFVGDLQSLTDNGKNKIAAPLRKVHQMSERLGVVVVVFVVVVCNNSNNLCDEEVNVS